MADARIKHVVVLMLENRSFDHMLGFLSHGGLKPVIGESNPADPKHPTGVRYDAFALQSYDKLSHDPMHAYPDVMSQLTAKESGWTLPGDLTNQGFAWNYHERTGEDGGEVLGCYDQDRLPVLYALAREYIVCARWFCSAPTLTWPNRLFAHAGTSDDLVENETRFYSNPTVFEAVSKAGHSWRIYAGDIPQVAAYPALWGYGGEPRFFDLSDFFEDARTGVLKNYSFIEPHHLGWWTNSQHPKTQVPLGERLIRDVYDAIASNQQTWESTLLLITYDEHGGFFDREPPPPAIPPHPGAIDPTFGFRFDLLGPRVPAIVVSPYVSKGKVDQDVTYDHTSIIATLREIFDVTGALGDRAAHATGVSHLLTEPAARSPIELPPPANREANRGPSEWAAGINDDGTIRLNDLQEELVSLATLIEQEASPPEPIRPGVEPPPLRRPPFREAAEIDDFVRSFRRRQLNRM